MGYDVPDRGQDQGASVSEPEVIEDKTLVVDDQDFTGTEFRNCVLVYSGGGISMSKTVQKGCRWRFDGPAGNTLYLMRRLYAEGYVQMMERTFDYIRGIDQAPPTMN